MVNGIEFSNDRIRMMIKKISKWYLFGLNSQRCDDLKRKLSAFREIRREVLSTGRSFKGQYAANWTSSESRIGGS